MLSTAAPIKHRDPRIEAENLRSALKKVNVLLADEELERYEFLGAPSAGVLQHCLRRAETQRERQLKKPPSHTSPEMCGSAFLTSEQKLDAAETMHAVLCGAGDERATSVSEEVESLARLFHNPRVLSGEDATVSAVKSFSAEAGILHLACHGQFRPDNPRFSSLKLADGHLTVHDAATLDLRGCRLVTLSACETGVNLVAPGEELIGLARGFFAAGAPSLLLSLWTVDDATTARLMTDFYAHLHAQGDSDINPAASLRAAQLRLLETHPHPFFWSPFVLVGSW